MPTLPTRTEATSLESTDLLYLARTPFAATDDRKITIANTIDTTNLQLTSGKINTIQDISTSSKPTFDALTISTQDVQVDAFGDLLLGYVTALNSSTGVFDYDGATAGTNPTDADIGAGYGHVVDNFTDPTAPTHLDVTWSAQTIAIAAIADGDITWVYVDNAGIAQQQTTAPTSQEIRTNIYLSQIIIRDFGGGPFVFGVQDFPSVAVSPSEQVQDLYDGIGTMNLSCTVSNGGTDLTVDFSGGELLTRGRNFVVNRATPNTVTLAGSNPAQFIYSTQDPAVSGGFVTDVDPANYDVGGVVTAVPAGVGTRATAQRISVFPNGVIGIQYGQQIYASLSTCIQGVSTDPYVTNPTFGDGGAVLLAVLCVTVAASDLSSSTEARFLSAGKFGESFSAGAGQSVSTLQQTYNNSTSGTIITDATRLAFDIQGGSGTDTDIAFSVSNNAGTATFEVQASGLIPEVNTPVVGTLASTGGNLQIHGEDDTIITTGEYDVSEVEIARFLSTGELGLGTDAPIYRLQLTNSTPNLFEALFIERDTTNLLGVRIDTISNRNGHGFNSCLFSNNMGIGESGTIEGEFVCYTDGANQQCAGMYVSQGEIYLLARNVSSASTTDVTLTDLQRLKVSSNGMIGLSAITDEHLRIGENTTSTYSPYASWYYDGSRKGYIQADVGGFDIVADSPMTIRTSTTDSLILQTNNTDAITINSSQQVTFASTIIATSIDAVTNDLTLNSDSAVALQWNATDYVTLSAGEVQFSVQPVFQSSVTPPTAASAGVTGQFTWDASYLYICIAANTWRRVAHATW